jgi:hypothetical protein
LSSSAERDYLQNVMANGRTISLHDRVNARRYAKGKKLLAAPASSGGRWVRYGEALRFARWYGARFGLWDGDRFVDLDPDTLQPS